MNSKSPVRYDNSILLDDCQCNHLEYLGQFAENFGEVLSDLTPLGKERPWVEKKSRNLQLADIYADFDYSKEHRLRDCGNFLQFKVFSDGTKKLGAMKSCRVRLCPICAWRRSLKTFYNNLAIVKQLENEKDYRFIFLTLTVRNCTRDKLKETMDELDKAVHRMYERSEWKKVAKGACRCVEVTHNVDKSSKWYDTFHPHIHFMIAVNKSYFKKNYLSKEKWRLLWESCARLDYECIIDVKACYKKINNSGEESFAKACAETSKYSTKDVEYIIPDNWQLSVDTVKLLDEVLAHRRLLTYTGCFREVRKELMKNKKISDEETGSLVNIGESEDDPNKDFTIQTFVWFSGYRQYVCID